MRYRIYFPNREEAMEVITYDLRVIGPRRVALLDEAGTAMVNEVLFGLEFNRIADDHDRTVYEK